MKPTEDAIPSEYSSTLRLDREERPIVPIVIRWRGPTGSGEHKLAAGTLRIGSGPESEVMIDEPSVSRQHTELTLTPEGITVRDLGSTNGTFCLGHRIGVLTVSAGATITIGSVHVQLVPDAEHLVGGEAFPHEVYRGILGRSARMRALFSLLYRLEGSLASALIEGESGSGKEGVARAIHEGSTVSKGAFLAINCGAIPRELAASELFGHVRGAFTGAQSERRGAFQQADGGTLFLDEIGELPLDLQSTLLRALDSGEIRPVGSDRVEKVRVRVLAATNRDLEAEVAEGRFRQDLFFRLAVVRIQLPPLRTRRDDIPLLAEYFAHQEGLTALPADILDELVRRNWTGNVRELRNAVQSYAALGCLPAAPVAIPMTEDDWFRDAADPTVPYHKQRRHLIEGFTRAYLRALLAYTNGNRAAAARVGKLNRTYLTRMLSKYRPSDD